MLMLGVSSETKNVVVILSGRRSGITLSNHKKYITDSSAQQLGVVGIHVTVVILLFGGP